jgi:hypothetical protein
MNSFMSYGLRQAMPSTEEMAGIMGDEKRAMVKHVSWRIDQELQKLRMQYKVA